MRLNLQMSMSVKAPAPVAFSRSQLAGHQRMAGPVVSCRPSTLTRSALEQNADVSASARPPRMSREESWKLAVERQESAQIHEYVIRGFNKGGLMIKLGEAKGFIPFSYLNPARFPNNKVPSGDVLEALASAMVGTKMNLRVMRVDVPARDLVLSERSTLMDSAIQSYKVGDVKDVIVKNATDFGAFVTVLDAQGKTTGVDGLIRLGELSWNRVSAVTDVLKVGQRIQVKVLSVDTEKRKVAFSLKAMTKDPLFETLDEVLPIERLASANWRAATEPLEGLDVICKELLAEQGITGVTLGRQAEERRAVSQDLELYLTNLKVEDGYNLVARAGMLVQEVHVSTKLSRDDMKKAIQTALKKI